MLLDHWKQESLPGSINTNEHEVIISIINNFIRKLACVSIQNKTVILSQKNAENINLTENIQLKA